MAHKVDAKKMAAIMAAVLNYVKSYEEARAAMGPATAAAPPAAGAAGHWGVSGRLDTMQLRRLMQMRTYR